MEEKTDWMEFLSSNLVFPFDGIVDDSQDPGSLVQYGDKLVVAKITGDDDKYGIIAGVRMGRSRRHLPIVDIAIADSGSPNKTTLDVYKAWFANELNA